jgi:hypothetical protein
MKFWVTCVVQKIHTAFNNAVCIVNVALLKVKTSSMCLQTQDQLPSMSPVLLTMRFSSVSMKH